MKITKNALLLPKNGVDIGQLLSEHGRSDLEISRTLANTGVSRIRCARPKLLTEFVFDGLTLLHQRDESYFRDVEAVIVISQTYDQRIPFVSTRIQNKFNIKPSAFCIDVVDGCAGYIKALSLVKMLDNTGFKKILIVAGDINSMMTSEAEIGTKILFGDGFSVFTMEADKSDLDIRLFNEGDHENVITCDISDNILHMNGYEVFHFTRNVVPTLIRSYLEQVGKSLDQYDLLALHQASRLVVSTICNTLEYKNSYGVDFACGEIGNIGAGSIGAWLANIKQLESKGELSMLAVGFGSGLSWGLASVTVDVERNEIIYV